ncbi:unnamed protein product [Brassica rapa subsp. trilocularis]|uniref:(rape) hypothetical protein n=1 Tax=Brassica napus TaxID=3708 RepID=A0A816VWV8_BRANA|nr:unnamed protein product [Brassica napus]
MLIVLSSRDYLEILFSWKKSFLSDEEIPLQTYEATVKRILIFFFRRESSQENPLKQRKIPQGALKTFKILSRVSGCVFVRIKTEYTMRTILTQQNIFERMKTL